MAANLKCPVCGLEDGWHKLQCPEGGLGPLNIPVREVEGRFSAEDFFDSRWYRPRGTEQEDS